MDHFLPTNTDYEELMPQDTPELVELRELREIVGTGGAVNFMVESDDVTSTVVLNWQQDYLDRALSMYPQLISGETLAMLVSQAAGGVIPPQPQTDAILESIPPQYVSQFLSSDGRMTKMSFEIAYLPLEEIHELLQMMQAEAQAPEGVTFSPVGGIALGAELIDAVVGSRLSLNLICLGAVCVVLVVVYRRFGSTVFTIIPVGAVIAWSSLDMYLIGIPLNPLTAM